MYSEGVLYYYVRGIYRYWPLNRVDRIVTVSSNEIDSICNCTIYTMVFVEHLYSEISTLIWTVYTLCITVGGMIGYTSAVSLLHTIQSK